MRFTFKKVFFLLVYLAIVILLPLYIFRSNNLKNISVQSVDGTEIVKTIESSGTSVETILPENLAEVYDVNVLKLYPQYNLGSDRIIQQLEYKPTIEKEKEILIYLTNNFGGWNVQWGEDVFGQCNFRNCKLTESRNDGSKADAVVFRHSVFKEPKPRPMGQIWILYLLENPHNTPSFYNWNYKINYSATYRFDSDIVTPYEKFRYTYANESESENQLVNYATGKTKPAAWFVSNCMSKNEREKYTNELKKYIQVDVYGSCGKFKCQRLDTNCFQILNKDYKFYLSFENGNCQDYITEKFFINGLQNNVIPVVMGASKREYLRVAPEHSFIHVDDFDSAKSLANYLDYLDKNDTAYNEYFAWKHKGSYEFMNTKFWCRLCTMLNNPVPKVYANFDSWWRGPGVCRKSSKIDNFLNFL